MLKQQLKINHASLCIAVVSAYMTDREGKIVARSKEQPVSIAVNENSNCINKYLH